MIGLRENLQETMVFTIKYGGFPVNFPLNQSIGFSNGPMKHGGPPINGWNMMGTNLRMFCNFWAQMSY